MNNKPLFFLIATPVMETVNSRFHMCMVRLIQHMTVSARKVGGGFSYRTVETSSLPVKRNNLVSYALSDSRFTHILWIDSDMVFPVDLAYRLAAWNEPIVACSCSTKTLPPQLTALRGPNPDIYNPVPINGDGLEVADFVGMGVMLTETEVFRRVPAPWFNMIWRDDRQCYEGEDWFFLRKAQEHGYQAKIDAAASREIGHVGAFAFTADLVYTEEEDQGAPSDPVHGDGGGRVHAQPVESRDARQPGD